MRNVFIKLEFSILTWSHTILENGSAKRGNDSGRENRLFWRRRTSNRVRVTRKSVDWARFPISCIFLINGAVSLRDEESASAQQAGNAGLPGRLRPWPGSARRSKKIDSLKDSEERKYFYSATAVQILVTLLLLGKSCIIMCNR